MSVYRPWRREDWDGYECFAFEQITVGSTAIGFTASTVQPASGKPATLAVCAVETQPVRWRSDGTAPTSSAGYPQAVASEFTVFGSHDLNNFKAIRTGGTSATLTVAYYR